MAGKQRRWFFKVVTETDAVEAVDVAATIFYALAAILAILTPLLLYAAVMPTSDAWGMTVRIPLIVFLASTIRRNQSRAAALALMTIAFSTAAVTLANLLDITDYGDPKWRLIYAPPAVYGAYMGLHGTFKYHAIKRTSMLWRRALALNAITIVYVFVASIAYHMVIVFPLHILKFSGYYVLGEEVIERFFPLLIIFIVWLASWRLLPGTRRLAVIAPARDSGSTELTADG